LLSALVTLRTGQTAEEYARRNIFEPLGIRAYSWPTDKQGNSRGWGDLKLLSPDMARLGYLFLHKGRWNGKQVVSSRWVEEATRKHINAPGAAGYGYQWWLRDDPPRYEALGRAGQRITVLPSLDAVVVFTGGGFEPSEVGDFIGRALRGDRLPEDPAGYAVLKEKVAAAARAPAPRQVPPVSSIAREISGKRYLLETNPMGLASFSFTFGGGDAAVFRLGYPDRTESRPLGLDGVYRVTRETPDAEPDAVKGEWISQSEFRMFFNEFTESKLRIAEFAFGGDGVVLRVTDPYDALDTTIPGTAE
jgi:hypothetical protein